MTQIMIVDDHVMVREGLRLIIEREPDMNILKEAGNAADALDFLKNHEVDIVLLDIILPDKNGIDVLKEIHNRHMRVSVLVLSMYPEDKFGVRAIQAGAAGYLTKGNAAEDLVNAIRKIRKGGRYVSPSLGEVLASEVHHDKTVSRYGHLSDREFEIMLMIGAGESRAEIARHLNLSPATVSTYRRRVMAKLNLNTNSAVVRYVVEHNLVI